jgi:hypothetical protein
VKPYYDDGTVTIYHGDCRDLLPTLDPAALLLSDPPYPGYEKGWEVPDVAGILARAGAQTTVIFWPVLVPSPLSEHAAEHVWEKPNGQSRYHYERILVAGDAPAAAKVYRVAAILTRPSAARLSTPNPRRRSRPLIQTSAVQHDPSPALTGPGHAPRPPWWP